MEDDKKTQLGSRQKMTIAGLAVLLILILCFVGLAVSGKKPAADYTGLWKTGKNSYSYVVNGQTAADYSGAITDTVDGETQTLYVRNGSVDFNYTGLGTSEEGWVYFTDGVLDNTYRGFAKAGDTWYLVEDGAVDLSYTGAQKGEVDGTSGWWYLMDGQVDLSFTGAAKTDAGIWFFKNGKLDETYSGIQKVDDGWYYFTNGKQDKSYKGIATNEYGVWYVRNGKVDFDYSGKVTHLGRTYQVTEGVVGNGKTVYLTFDDGPGMYTDDLLKILAKHKVKATFFVTGFYKNYLDCLTKEAKAGHTIGVHTYTHKYAAIYKSEQAYWDDFEQMEKLIEEKTGERTDLFRFPGGSSNAVSKKYSEGIMTQLVEDAEKKGLVYFDWNVLSGDAGNTKDSDQIYKNIINGCSQHTHNVVLCHDIHDFTVNAMDKTIAKLLKEGYVLLPLDRNSPTCHQHVSN